MFDILEHMKSEEERIAKQAAAAVSGHVITIRVVKQIGYVLVIDTNHPALVIVDGDMDDVGYTLTGGAVHCLTGTCPSNMVSLEELATQSVEELVIGEEGESQLVIQIPQPETLH